MLMESSQWQSHQTPQWNYVPLCMNCMLVQFKSSQLLFLRWYCGYDSSKTTSMMKWIKMKHNMVFMVMLISRLQPCWACHSCCVGKSCSQASLQRKIHVKNQLNMLTWFFSTHATIYVVDSCKTTWNSCWISTKNQLNTSTWCPNMPTWRKSTQTTVYHIT